MSKFTDVLMADILQTLAIVVFVGFIGSIIYCFATWTTPTSIVIGIVIILWWLLSVYDRSRNS